MILCRCMLDAAEGVGVVSRKGAWYSYGETRLGQGRDKTLTILQDDDALAGCVMAKDHLRLRSTVRIVVAKPSPNFRPVSLVRYRRAHSWRTT